MLLSLAQSPEGPIHLVTGAPPVAAPPMMPLWLGLTIIAAVVVIALVAWFVLWRRAAVENDPAEYAFRTLCRHIGVQGRRQALLRRLAATARCAPVALLVSDSALRTAALCHERSNPGRRDRALLKDLSA